MKDTCFREYIKIKVLDGEGTYTGSCIEGTDKPHGSGRLIYKNGDVFSGMFSKGLPVEGSIRFKNGTHANVSYKYNLFHTKYEKIYGSKFSIRNFKKEQTLNLQGCVYVGEVRNGMREGVGQVTYDDGTVLVSGWSKNEMHGVCKITYNDGHIDCFVCENGFCVAQLDPDHDQTPYFNKVKEMYSEPVNGDIYF